MRRSGEAPVAFALLVLALGHSAMAAEAEEDAARRALLDVKLKLMSADYRADLEELARGRDLLTTLGHHPTLGHVARYWAGFASHRLAVNGTNRGMAAEEIERNLLAALEDFDAALAVREDFAEAHVGAAGATSWLLGIAFSRGGIAEAERWIGRTRHHLERARTLAPENPRLAWIEGGIRYSTPADHGGSREEGRALWRRAIEQAKAEAPDDPLMPDWGRAEALMSLAWAAHFDPDRPNPAEARDWAEAALELRPEWYYVREVLLPQIDATLVPADAGTDAPSAGGSDR